MRISDRHLVLFCRVALALALFLPAAVAAQVQTEKPIKIKTPKPKRMQFKGEVLSCNNHQMMVRSQENERIVRTFSYTPEVREKIQKIIDAGGYQYGDRVTIEHDAQSDVAVKIKGKPSKPI